MYLFRAPEWIKKNHRLFSLTFSWWNFDLLTVAWGLPDYISRIGFPSFAKERWFWLTEGSWFSILLQLSNSSHSTIISCTESILCFQCKIWMNLWGAIHPVWRWDWWSNIAYGEGQEGKKVGSDNIWKGILFLNPKKSGLYWCEDLFNIRQHQGEALMTPQIYNQHSGKEIHHEILMLVISNTWIELLLRNRRVYCQLLAAESSVQCGT